MTRAKKVLLILGGAFVGFTMLPPMQSAQAQGVGADLPNLFPQMLDAITNHEGWVLLGLAVSVILSGVEKFGAERWEFLGSARGHALIASLLSASGGFTAAMLSQYSNGKEIATVTVLILAAKITGAALLTDIFPYTAPAKKHKHA